MNYMKITSPDVNNGIGCRVTLWVAGCHNNCPGCHNKETWDKKSGKEFDSNALGELFDKLEKPYIAGLTLSGGEPLDLEDPEKLISILELVKKFRDRFGNTKNLWIYSGYLLGDLENNIVTKEILEHADFLVDGKFDQTLADKSLAFRGSKNQIVWKKEGKYFIPEKKLN